MDIFQSGLILKLLQRDEAAIQLSINAREIACAVGGTPT